MSRFLCKGCGAVLDNDTVALNLRLRGNGIGSFYCDECFGRMLHTSPTELDSLKAHFKRIGCTLFERQYVE